MYEIFNWGSKNGSCTNDQRPKRLQLSIIGNEINIDDPPTPPRPQQHHQQSHSTPTTNFHYNYKKPGMGWSWSIFSTIFNNFFRSHVMCLYVRSKDICMEWTFFVCDVFFFLLNHLHEKFCCIFLHRRRWFSSSWTILLLKDWYVQKLHCLLTCQMGSDRRATNLTTWRHCVYAINQIISF